MGVKRVLLWPFKDVNSELQRLQDVLESLGAKKRPTRWRVVIGLYHRKRVTPGFKKQEIFMVRTSDSPEQLFTYIVNEREKPKPLTERVLLESTKEGAIILQKLDLYTMKLEATMEGFHYDLGDFEIKIGVCRMRSNQLKGMVVEIHYTPCQLALSCASIMQEVLFLLGDEKTVQGVALDDKDLIELYQASHLPHKFSSRHSALQFVHLFNKLV